MEKISNKSLGWMAEAIKDKNITSQQLVKYHLDRIDDINSCLNAVVQVAKERALNEAEMADEKLVQGEVWGPLHGVPVTIKDSIDTAEIITTGGTEGRESFVPDRDATVVKRLRQAGAIIIGKTNTPELTLEYETVNKIYGRTNNPYDISKSPGGSSGGAASIVAAGGSPLDIGSDTAGSIRLPAHFCGIAGLKPTNGRVPGTGTIIPPGSGIIDDLTQLGPLARYVDDLAMTFPIIAGVDWKDPSIVPVEIKDYRNIKLDGLKVGFYTDNGIYSPDNSTVKVIEECTGYLSNIGCKVEEVSPPNIEQTFDLFKSIFAADGWTWKQRLLKRYGTINEFTPRYERSLSGVEFNKLITRWQEFKSDMISFINEYDILLSPTTAFAAQEHGFSTIRSVIPSFSYTMVHNLTGWPAVVLKGGEDDKGMPIGIQIASPPWREDLALAVAKFIEKETGGWEKPQI